VNSSAVRSRWPFVGSTALAVSLTGPSYLADGIAAVVLITMHVAVGAILIWGFATQRRWVPNQSRTVS
jgi:FtsH-binding integral membrane protein